jgi:hypothetical protein
MEKKRNLWVIPTDKPTYLYEMEGKFHLSDKFEKGNDFWHNQNIYITSDEEIKEGYHVFNTKNNHYGGVVNKNNLSDARLLSYIKKIILTTDQALISKTCVHNFVNIINDGFQCTKCKKHVLRSKITVSDTTEGVQAIDNEFLEWFVKNPSCESVGIEKECCGQCDERLCEIKDLQREETIYNTFYKIIIPKEEPKQDCECTDECLGYLTKNCKGIEQPKQETLEEIVNKLSIKEAKDLDLFLKGAKWQQERMYSEEEVLDLLQNFNQNAMEYIKEDEKSIMTSITLKKWFEQFKKKL